jgi:hypothetical protein
MAIILLLIVIYLFVVGFSYSLLENYKSYFGLDSDEILTISAFWFIAFPIILGVKIFQGLLWLIEKIK